MSRFCCMNDFCEECGTMLLNDEECSDCGKAYCGPCEALHVCDPDNDSDF